VKIQFLKTFILPYFDYWLSLLIYFPKTTIQRINNCFNLCLYKLLNFKKSVDNSVEEFNENLSNYGLFSFQHRIMFKLFNFSHSIINNSNSPADLHQVFKQETYLKSRARSASLLLPAMVKKLFNCSLLNFLIILVKKISLLIMNFFYLILIEIWIVYLEILLKFFLFLIFSIKI
jgi:hypothetical protein